MSKTPTKTKAADYADEVRDDEDPTKPDPKDAEIAAHKQTIEELETGNYSADRQWAIKQAVKHAAGQGYNQAQMLELAEAIWNFSQPKA